MNIMADGVSISDVMLLPLLLMVLLGPMTLPMVESLAFSSAYGSTTIDPFSNYSCPNECMCYKINESTNSPTAWINCTIPFFTPHLANVIKQVSSPLTVYAFFTCSYSSIDYQDVPPESNLWDGVFQNVGNLEVLVFDNCKFKTLTKNAFQGLSSLSKLTIQRAEIQSLDVDLLTHLPRLNELEISDSSLKQFIPLCTARLLRVFNISGNHLVSLDDAGLHCAMNPLFGLEIVDVNRNFITDIPDWLGQSIPNLYALKTSDNYVSFTKDSPFSDLTKLTLLDISNNSITSLSPMFFEGCTSVHLLELSSNRVQFLPSGLLTDLSVLVTLGIADMGLDDRVWIEMAELRQLVQLNMSHNELTTINSDVMGQFLRLESCNLEHNKISSFPRGAFDYQYELTTLDLSHNNIPDLPSDAFGSQDKLKYLFLQHNNISTIGHDAFSALKEVLTFDISHNSIQSLPPKAFHGLIKVKNLALSSNQFRSVDQNLFSNTLQLTHLNMSHNMLEEVPVLSHMTSLEVIDLSYNNISSLDPSIFLDLHDLTTVVLSHNSLTRLPLKLFKGCDVLRTVDLSYNLLKELHEATFDSAVDLNTINLAHNEITDFSTAFSGLKYLRMLDLSYNKLTKVLRGQFPHLIEHIDLRANSIDFISAHTFKSLNNIKTVDLSSNKLTTLKRMDVEIAFNMGYSPEFALRFNPFICDCNLGWLKDWSEGKLKDMLTLPSFVDIAAGLSCSNPFYSFKQRLQFVPRSQFLCNYTKHCEESCMCCDFDGCNCKYICPTSCQCFIGDDYWHVHHVQCSSAGLTAVPEKLPEGATDLRLDGNDIQILKRHNFLALTHLETLYLNHSHIHTIQNNTFKGLKSVKRLYLNDNHMTSIYPVTFKGLESLEELYLYNNDIFSVDSQSFLYLQTLSLLSLQGNALVTISVDDLWSFTNRSLTDGLRPRLYLSGNPWSCDQDFACKLLQFVHANSEYIEDISYIECIPSGTTEKPNQIHQDVSLLLDLPPEFCGYNHTLHDNMTRQSMEVSSSKTETYALIAACVVVVFAIALLIVAYVNRHLLQVLCFTRFGCRVFKMAKAADDNERPYDAFISYSNKDEEFVIRQLAPRLENGDKKFRLCVHYRDFPVGACIAETIVRSVEASKRTILVVSDNFLDSEWCRFEFQTAHQQVLSERRNRVILILMHDLDTEKLDSTLKVYMRTRTYLKLDDPWFWEKLMFAMPDIRHRKSEMPSRLPSSRDLEYMARDRRLAEQQQSQTGSHTSRNGSRCETIHNDMYEIPVLDSNSIHYQLANGRCCSSTHTNSAYHNSDGSDSTSGFHNGSVCGSCGHYEECGPGSSSVQSTPQKFIGTPPPVPSIPKEGFIPREKLKAMHV